MNFIQAVIQTKREANYQRYLNEMAIATIMYHHKPSHEEIIKGIELAAATNRSRKQFERDYKELVIGDINE